MKKVLVVGSIIFFIAAGVITVWYLRDDSQEKAAISPIPSIAQSPTNTNPMVTVDPSTPVSTVIAEGLDTPWSIVFLPDETLLVAERKGTIQRITPASLESQQIATLEGVSESGEGGLLGMTLNPDFITNSYIYLYYTYSTEDNNTFNRVSRMRFRANTLEDEEIIVDAIPGASNHNGGRIKFGPDKYLYITTGDSQEPSFAQDTISLAGKILRVTDMGQPAPDNPFGNRIYSYGHRNPQGLAWDDGGRLWSTEHGRSGLQSGLDELNLIEIGKNYGWPTIEGNEQQEGMQTPIAHSGTTSTWAPGSATYANGSIYFGGLRGAALYEVILNGSELREHFKNDYGRIREAIVGPDGYLYITTSNNDGRGRPQEGDDKIIKINIAKL